MRVVLVVVGGGGGGGNGVGGGASGGRGGGRKWRGEWWGFVHLFACLLVYSFVLLGFCSLLFNRVDPMFPFFFNRIESIAGFGQNFELPLSQLDECLYRLH